MRTTNIVGGDKIEPKEMDSDLVQRLVYSKDLYLSSRHLQSLGHNVALAEALVLADAAIESLLRTHMEYCDIPFKSDERYPSLIEKLKQNESCNNLEFRPLMQLHRIRNDIQHRYVIPVESQVDQYITNAVLCSNELSQRIFNLRWTEISMAELFKDRLTKILYQRAEIHYKNNKIKDAIIFIISSFEYAKFLEQTRIFGSLISWNVVTSSNNPEIQELIQYCNKIHDEIEVLKLRLDYKEYRRYCDMAPSVLSPKFSVNFAPNGFNIYSPNNMGVTMLYEHWEEKLSKTSTLYKWNQLDIDMALTERAKADWLPFAFKFVEKSILNWQRVTRMGIVEILSK